ncbi:FecR domain-containing protein [Dyella terrae]|uniref:FecR domain-containing protein n=1 Tax=Dyella terrae TaxID=522259 RepID=UPI001EFCF724|nr:FecR domain-containing protein [Dyella terrae]ULU26066.1 FecR domain-containing protein [Dyella terrae]
MSLRSAEHAVVLEASRWFARLHAEQATEDDRQAWARWYSADPSHQRAWQLVEEVRAQFGRLPGTVAGRALDAAGRARRRALGQLVAVLGVGSVGMLAWRQLPWEDWLAEYRTRVGQRRDVALPDGSALSLNTASAVDVEFSSARRLLKLRAGEVMIRTGADPAAGTHRPFVVATRQGDVLALGTQFTVRTEADYAEVSVLEKSVKVQPATGAAPLIVPAGYHVRFTAHRVEALQPNDVSVASWQYGSIIAVDMPLEVFIAELSRYRTGYLGCHPSIAALKISGAFPIDDTNRALDALTHAFPVRVVRRTRLWVTLEPR